MTGAISSQKNAIRGINHDDRQEFLSLCLNRRDYIYKAPGKSWITVKRFPISDETILSSISGEEKAFFGLRWGERARFAVLDIDKNSRYHNDQELQKLQEKLSAVGLSVVPYRSSESGGWHLYLFLSDWTDSIDLRETLKQWLHGHGYEIRNGTLEIFPSGMGLRLPLQRGFGWLNNNGELIAKREELTTEAAISRFLLDLEINASDWPESKRLIETELQAGDYNQGVDAQAHWESIDTDGFDGFWNIGKQRGRNPETIQEAQSYLDNGLTERGKGQRHYAIVSIQHLLWFGDLLRGVPRLPGYCNVEKRVQFLLNWLKNNHNSYSSLVNQGNWRQVEAPIRRACEWRRQNHQPTLEYQPYMSTEKQQEILIGLTKKTGHVFTAEDLERANLKSEDRARKKILEAKQRLIDQDRKVSIRALSRESGCHRDTIRRHSDIWEISQAVSLSNGTLHLDPVGLGGCAQIQGHTDGTGAGARGCYGSEEKTFSPTVLLGDSRQAEVGQGEVKAPDFSGPEGDVDEGASFTDDDMLEHEGIQGQLDAENPSRKASDAVGILIASRLNIPILQLAYFQNSRKRLTLTSFRAASRAPPMK